MAIRPLKMVVNGLFILITGLYPVLIYKGLTFFDGRILAVIVCSVLGVRSLLTFKKSPVGAVGFLMVAVLIGGSVLLSGNSLYLKLYPVLTSLTALGIFGTSLIFPPSIIEKFARLEFKDKPMPPPVVAYTRRVTQVWCGFFAMNASIALYTVFLSLKAWTLYNGLISYVLMGTLFAGEFIYRHLVVKKRS